MTPDDTAKADATLVGDPAPSSYMPAKPRRRWRKWLVRFALAFAVLLILIRITLPWTLPFVASKVGASQGLDITWEKLDLALLTGEFELWHLDVRPTEDRTDFDADQPLASIEFLRVDVDMSALLTGNIKVHRVEVDGVRARVERLEDGSLVLGSTSSEPDEPEEPDEPDESEPSEPEPLDLSLPVEIAAIRVQDVLIELHDRAVTPPLQASLTCSVRISDLGSETRPARLEVELHSPELIERFHIQGEGTSGARSLDAELTVHGSGIRPEPLAPYLQALGITPEVYQWDLDAHLTAHVAACEDDELCATARVVVDDVAFLADGDEVVALDAMEVDIGRLHAQRVTEATILVRGVRGHARRLEDGALKVAGLVMRGAPPAADAESDAEAAAPEPAPDASDAEATPFILELDALRVEGVELAFLDEGVSPAVDHRVAVPSASIAHVVLDPDRVDEVLTLDVDLAIDGVCPSLSVNGSAAPFAEAKTFGLEVQGTSFSFMPLAPYLAAAGLAPTLDGGAVGLRVDATLRTSDTTLELDAELSDIALTHADGTRPASLDAVRIAGLVRDSPNARLTVRELAVEGPQLTMRRDAERALHVFGLKTVPAAPAPANAPANTDPVAADTRVAHQDSSAAATEEDAGPPMRIEVLKASVTGASLTYDDAALTEPLHLVLDDLGVTLDDLKLGGDAEQYPESSARLHAWFRADDLADQLDVEGSITSRPGALDLDVDFVLTGRNLRTVAVDSLLTDVGVESTLTSASLDGRWTATVKQEGDVLDLDTSFEGLAWSDAGLELVAADQLSIDSLRVTPERIDLGHVTARGLRAGAHRDASGIFAAAGFRFVGVEAEPALEEAPATTRTFEARSHFAQDDPATSEEGEGDDAGSDEPTGPVLHLPRADLQGVALQWRDDFVDPPVATVLRAEGWIQDVLIEADASPATFELALSVDDVLPSCAFTGEVALTPDSVDAVVDLDANGLEAGPLASYFPPTVEPAWNDARMKGRFEAHIHPAAVGGHQLRVVLSDVDYRNADELTPFLTLDALTLIAPRIDPTAAIYDVETLRCSGLECTALRTAPDRIEAMGIAIVQVAPVVEEVAEETGEILEETAEDVVEEVIPDTPSMSEKARGTSEPARRLIPTLRTGTLELGIAGLHWHDRTDAQAEPLHLTMSLTAPDNTTWIQPDPEDLPASRLDLHLGVVPVLDDLHLALEVSPFAPAPYLKVAVEGTGIHGDELASVFPGLSETLDASGLENGVLHAKLDVVAQVRRRDPLTLDPYRPISLEARVEDVRLQAVPDGPVLVGLDGLYADVSKISPQTGDVQVRTLIIRKPVARLRQLEEGLLVAGVLLKPVVPPEEALEDAAVETADATTDALEGDTPDLGGEAGGVPGPEFRIDELLVNGIDVVFVDESVEPIMTVPLTDLDVEVRGFTTRALTEPKSIRYRVLADAGKVELPERIEGDPLLLGVLGAVANKVAGSSDEAVTEERSWFGTMETSGRLKLFPALEGFAKVELRDLELLAFRGAASASGVDIGEGLMDTTADVRFLGERGMDVSSKTVFRRLSVTEPPDGPISKYLRLPAPLDTVLFVLRNDNDEQVIPVDFHMDPDGLSAGQITKVAGTVLLSVITDAIASAPFRVAGPLTGLVGDLLEQDSDVSLDEATMTVSFAPGAVSLQGIERDELARVAQALRGDPNAELQLTHTIGGGDRALAQRLANPGPAVIEPLVARLRARRADLWSQRDQLSADIRTRRVVGGLNDEALEQLRALERDLADCEQALDQALTRLRPGAERSSDRRTRDACLIIARARLEAMRDALLRAGAPSNQVRIRRPRYEEVEGEEGGSLSLIPRTSS